MTVKLLFSCDGAFSSFGGESPIKCGGRGNREGENVEDVVCIPLGRASPVDEVGVVWKGGHEIAAEARGMYGEGVAEYGFGSLLADFQLLTFLMLWRGSSAEYPTAVAAEADLKTPSTRAACSAECGGEGGSLCWVASWWAD